MSDSYYLVNNADSHESKRIKLWDNGDGTFNTSERRAVDPSVVPTRVNAGVKSQWPTTREGIPFTIGGHPDIQTKNLQITAADAGQVGTSIVDGFEGYSIFVTKISVNTATINSGNTSVRIGFGAVSTPSPDAHQVLFYESAMDGSQRASEGDGSGVIGIGAPGESLRLSCTTPTAGDLNIVVTYWITLVGTG